MSVGTFGPTPTLPNAGAGYQVGYGAGSIPQMGVQTVPPATYTGDASVTTDELLTGLLSYTGAGNTLTLPTAAQLDTAFSNAQSVQVGSSYDFGVNATTGAATLAGGTGVKTNAAGVGSLVVAAAASARFRLVKTGDAAWNLYRVG
jgi:hypothetical protein